MAVAEHELLAALAAVKDPHTGADLVSTRAVRNVQTSGGDVAFDVQLGYPAKTLFEALRKRFTAAAMAVPVNAITASMAMTMGKNLFFFIFSP